MTPYYASKYTVDENGCWLWDGMVNPNGYGRMRHEGRLQMAHRVFYETYIGPIPEGLTIDHVCRNRRCVRPHPDHLEAVTQRVNVLRGTGFPAQNAQKTQCDRGHEFTPENTMRISGRRRKCRTCHRQWNRDYMQRRRMSAAGVREAVA